MPETLSEAQLLAAARREGCKVSADQLKRWRHAGFIPRPTQSHPGGRRGSEATYSAGTLNQLLAVCRLREQFRSLERIRFELWWAGEYPGDRTPIRRFLITRLEEQLDPLRELRDQHDDPFKAASAAVDGPVESRDPRLRALRRLAKSGENLRSAMFAVFLDLFGGEVTWEGFDTGLEEPEPSLRDLVERATGVSRAKSDLLDSGQPLLSETADIVSTIQLMHRRGVINLDNPGWAIMQADDAELERARQDAALLVSGIGGLVTIYGARSGRDYGGLSALQSTVEPDPTMIAWSLQLSILLPSLLETDEEAENTSRTLEAFSQYQGQITCARLFLAEHPGYAFIFKPDGPDQLRSLTNEERELATATIRNFMKRHPECSAIFGSNE